MVPTVLPFFLDACESDSSTCGALTHLCCSGEAYPKYASAVLTTYLHCTLASEHALFSLL